MHRSLTLLVLLLIAGIVLPFVIWGEAFETTLSLQGSRAWMEGWGDWAWCAGLLLLVGDIVLPIPSTVVMSALGWMYGWFWGGCLAAAGSMLSGLTAYGLCRRFGRGLARRIAGEDGLQRAQNLFARGGGWLVALSRWTPVLPEAVACLAGLACLRRRVFVTALACGSLPLGFAFAAIGHLGHDSPSLALGLSAVVPALLWLVAWHLQGRTTKGK